MKIKTRLLVFVTFVFLISLLSSCRAGVSPFSKTITLKMPPAGEPAYVYVPFDVPAGIENISVSLEYDKKEGKNRLELGMFDERFSGKHDDKTGFRGWSGSIRDSLFIAKDDATYGYQKGEIRPGKWYLIVGLAFLEKESVVAMLKVTFNDIPVELAKKHKEETEKEFKSETKKPPPPKGWFRGDLHTHSFHSDGRWSVRAILDSAVANNLDFVSINDHNTFSHHQEIDTLAKQFPKLLILKGEEITTYGGHINAWGLRTGDWVDFRLIPNTTESGQKIADEAHELGAIVSANHPTMDCGGCGWTYGDWTQMDAVEVWNAKWDEQDEEALKMWDALLQKGKRITAIGSSDTHQPPYEPSDYPTNRSPGSPTVHIGAKSLSEQSLFEGIKDGYVIVTSGPEKRVEFFGLDGGDPVSVGKLPLPISTNGNADFRIMLSGFEKGSIVRLISVFSGSEAGIESIPMPDGKIDLDHSIKTSKNGYVRLEVRNPDGSMAAFTNPVWIKSD